MFTGLNAYGQSNTTEAHYKYGDEALWKFLDKKFSAEIKKNNERICLRSVTFAKFTIDTLGNIKALTFSENNDTPPIFRNTLTSVINATNGSWLPRRINGKAVESKLFILPLIYEMEAGCSINKIPVNDGTSNSLLRLLDFGGNKETQLDCILLKPLHVFSAN